MCTGGFESRHKYFAEENIAHQGQWLINILKNELKYVFVISGRELNFIEQ